MLSPEVAFIFRERPSIIPAGHLRRMGHGTMLDERKQVAAAIRDYIARERMSREQFAFKTKLGKSTVDKLLTGLFSEKTLAIVESHTNRYCQLN